MRTKPAVTATEKGKMLMYGPSTPEENPVRFRRCTKCDAVVDLRGNEGLMWNTDDDSFSHKVCPVAG